MKAIPYKYRRSGNECIVVFRHVHLASINVKSEDSILHEETVTRSHCTLKEICGALRVVREKYYYIGLVVQS